jgi:heme/copper-type cytochrome/quinol oxidase subunit 3
MFETTGPKPGKRHGSWFFVCAYGWFYAVYFGLVALDSAYAGLLRTETDSVIKDRIINEISDLLLIPFGILMLAGCAAMVAAKRVPRALHPLVISWLLPIALLAIAVVMGGMLEQAGYGTLLRLGTIAGGSALTMLALCRFEGPESSR